MRLAVLLVAFCCLTAPAFAQSSRIAIIGVGADATTVGAVQYRLEQALAAKGIGSVSSASSALRLAAGTPPPAPADERIAALLEEVKAGYIEDRLDDALLKLNEAANLIESGRPSPGADRVTVLSWRAAIAMAKDDAKTVAEEAGALLALAPQWQPNLNVFRPSFSKFIGELRVSQPSPVSIRLEYLPSNASFDVDGRYAESPFWISPGSHSLRVRAPGLRDAEIQFDAQADQTLVLQLAFELGPTFEPSVESAIWLAEPKTAPRAVVDLSARLGVDVVVLIGVREDGALRAAKVLSSGAMTRSEVATGSSAEASIAEWVSLALTPDPATAQAAATRAEPRGRIAQSSESETAKPGSIFLLDAGLSAVRRSRTLADPSGAGFDVPFIGVGAFANAALWVDAWTVGARIAIIEYGLSPAEVPGLINSNGGPVLVHGGRTLQADVLGGWRFLGSPDAFALTGQLEAVWESHHAEDVPDGKGDDAGFFTSYSRLAVGVGIDVEIPAGPARLHLGGAVHPLHVWSEDGSKNGRSPAGAPAFAWRAGAGLAIGGAWEIRAEYSGERRSVSFEGTADVAVETTNSNEPLNDVSITELFHSVSVAVRRLF